MEFWKTINIKQILNKVPDYTEFLSIEELDNSSMKLADAYENVSLFEIGKSKEGRIINCLKIGEGNKNILFFGFPHPNEPIGSLTVEFLSQYLAETPEFTRESGYTWFLVKAIDMDGAKLNEGWFKGNFDPLKRAKNYYRPPFHEQVEWTFPVEYKKLKFDSPIPATQALMKLMKEIKPYFLYSLHNAGFCGVYFYVSQDNRQMCLELQDLVRTENLPLHQGEPEMEFSKQLYPAIYQQFTIQAIYDYYESQGYNLNEFTKIGAGSNDYLQEIAGSDNFSLICEMPYIYDKALENSNPSEYNRREIIVEEGKVRKRFFSNMKKIFKQIQPYCNKDSRLYSTVNATMNLYKTQLNLQLGLAKTSPEYDRMATIAEAFDSKYASKYFDLNTFSQLGRLCEESYRLHPNHPELRNYQKQVEDKVEHRMKSLMSKVNLEVIPIRKLVRVQVGSGLIALKYISS